MPIDRMRSSACCAAVVLSMIGGAAVARQPGSGTGQGGGGAGGGGGNAPQQPAPGTPADRGAGKGDQGGMEAMFKQMAEANKPGAKHEWMKKFHGRWASKTTVFGEGGATVMTGEGTMTYRPEMGGRYLGMRYRGTFGGEPFEGAGTMGYCNAEKRFEATWYDSMTTDLMLMTGEPSADGKTLTLTGTSPEPDGTRGQMKEVLTFTSDDAFKSEFYMVAGGQDIKVMEITYTRREGDRNGDDDDRGKGKGKGEKGRKGG